MKRCLLLAAALQFFSLSLGLVEFASAEPPAIAPTSEQEAPREEGEDDEAVVDIERVFKEHTTFNAEIQQLKSQVHDFEQEIQTSREELLRLVAQLGAATDPDQKAKLEELRVQLTGEITSRVTEKREEFMVAEAILDNDLYKALHAAVARYSQEHGIRIVRRLEKAPVEIKVITVKNRKDVLEQINREVIYRAPDRRDITDAILARLNADSTPDAALEPSTTSN